MSSNATRVIDLYTALSAGAVGTVMEAMDHNIKWHVAEGNPFGNGDVLIGPSEVAQTVFSPVIEVIDDFGITPVDVVEFKDSVLAQVRYHGVRKADGETFDVLAAHLWRFQNGKAVYFQQYINTSAWAKAVSNE